MSTIFTRIIKREVPAHIIYEDERFIVFLDIIQTTPGHTLVAIKEEYMNIFDVPERLLGDFFKLVAKTAKAINLAFSPTGVNILSNNGEGAGQTVYHFHVHLVPRYQDDGLNFKLKNHMHEIQSSDYQFRAERLIKALIQI
ncbi:MAG: HIT family protein [Acholeplasmataceae bacterium]|jgi:histidine triad (HIT) family protein